MTFYTPVEMRELSLEPTAYTDLLVAIEEAILDAMADYTVTVDMSAATSEYANKLKADFRQLGYAIDDSTTPGSWIISW